MAALSKKLRSLDGGRVAFWCPGCREAHQITVVDAPSRQGPVWGYNGNPDAPTFTPSVLVRGVRIEGGDEELDRILDTCKLPEDRERMLADKRINTVCHSFVTDGRIQFLGDCTHALAGQTVDLPEHWEAC
ncbi:hypothetical protein GCM10011321_31270 [Youhaiella tibetensis]|uniref:Ammonia monooxygenase n=1 Tax=Paradevosia tibetensis TaxID=1447062 RepID=A0A5B9DKK9_9HYPH|nr:DUF6527 family protein [Youhaiella tibetensis]QEE18908.1 ammonia monooxygenase [Youhaiella tibetensis]GGF38066.1 hypothetical protein GCM10011321_31270 [Youhaiella tibetensis]